MSLFVALLIGLVVWLLTGSVLIAILVVLVIAALGLFIDRPYGYRRVP